MTETKERLMELSPNDILDEFEIKMFLGEGKSRFAKTYESKSDSAVKLFVVKETKPAYPLLYEKFQREAEILDSLNSSPYVMNRITEFRQEGMHNSVKKIAPYYAMELMDGDLANLLRNPDITLTLTDKLGIIVQIVAAAIDFHNIGICHRDLYADNILYKTTDENLICKVADFGSAKDIHRPQTNPYFEPTGNNGYSSPEAVVGLLGGNTVTEQLMQESDVFALGLMMYEILAGRRQESLHTAIAGVVTMARQNNMYIDKTTMEQRVEFLAETAMPTLEVGHKKIVDITINDILDSEELAVRLTKIMRHMLTLDYATRLSDLDGLRNELIEIKSKIEAR